MLRAHASRRRTRIQLAGGLVATLAAASLITSATQAAPGHGAAATSADHGHVFKNNGHAISSATGGSDLARVKDFLRSKGVNAATLKSLRTTGASWTFRGVSHQRFVQQVGGLRVYDAEAKAAYNSDGELIHLIDFISPVRDAGVKPAGKGTDAALKAAVKDLYPARSISTRQTGRAATTTTFAKGSKFLTGPQVEQVAVPNGDGSFSAGYVVETWDTASNDLYSTLVSGNGTVVSHELRTAQDEYNVFTEDPGKTPQTVVQGPGSGNAQSPAGWLSGSSQTSVNISGNNAHAYLDAVSDNKPDPGGNPITDGRFLTAADLGAQPSTEDNREVAVQNLFYLNNIIHDTLYDAGFTEAAGNFQEDNFGRGGSKSDSVDAEAQDGGGTDNANFATPPDGVNPRMQMYLWTGLGTHRVVVHRSGGDVSYQAQGAGWGAQLDQTGVTGTLAVADDGTAPTTNACEPLVGDYTGELVIADRGSCDFTVKAGNVQRAGGEGIIVANNTEGAPFTMGGDDPSVSIAGVMVSQSDGAAAKADAGTSTTIKLADNPPLSRDGDVDSDVVWHEYGHGLTWRMIGKMSGPLAGAIGEGMSDVLSVIANEDDRVGEYSASDPLGIRTAPYDNYPRTYGDITGSEVHLDGEVYGAIGWRLLQLYQAAGIDKSVLLADLVDGMNYTPREPTYEAMRDGILDGLAASGNSDRACMVWKAFAEYGVGVGAQGVVKGKRAIVTESFELPATCQP
ncbi:MAG TPA: M36 family metallopeptidase [Nocardioidaceae bacterium]|nr:M36 family metallopeptidase [Nocardioidaceae bacterium]